MPTVTLHRLGGMVTEPERWPARGQADYAEMPCVVARNVSWAREGAPEGRRGTQRLYSGGLGGDTRIDGAIGGIFRYRSRTGGEHIIVIGSATGKDTTVTVFAGRSVRLATANFQNLTTFVGPTIYYGAAFGDSFYIAGVGEPRFIRVRFQRTGVTIAEAELFDRALVPFSAADDPAPWLARAHRGAPLATFQGRLFMAGSQDSPDTLFWSNTGDALGWSAQNHIRIREGGRITALAPLDRYLLVFKERMTFVVRGGFSGVADTIVDVVDSARGSTSHRGTIVLPGAVITVSHDGIVAMRPGAATEVLSEDIGNWLRGETRADFAGDAARFVPVRESFVEAPAAWLPHRQEIVIALSNGRRGVGGTQQSNVRNLLLVGHLGGARVRWSFWENIPAAAGAATVLVAEALLGYVDADGTTTLLMGGDEGDVRIANVGTTDVRADNTAAAYVAQLTPAPVWIPPSGLWELRAVEVGFAETAVSTTGVVAVNYQRGVEDARFGGAAATVAMSGLGNPPIFGATLPITLMTTPELRRTAGLRGVVPWGLGQHLSIQRGAGTGLLPPIRAVTLDLGLLNRRAA